MVLDQYIKLDSKKLYKDLKNLWSYKTNPNSIKECNQEMYGENMAKAIEFLNKNRKYIINEYGGHITKKTAWILLTRCKIGLEDHSIWITYNFDSELIGFESN